MTQELNRIDALPVQMARIKGETELLPSVKGVENALRAVQIESELAGMDFQGIFETALLAYVENRAPSMGESAQGLGNDSGAGCRIPQNVRPDGRAGETAQHRDTEFLSSPCGVEHFLHGPFAHTLRGAVSPDIIGKQRTMALIDDIANRRADTV